jgi:hypothetical protein
MTPAPVWWRSRRFGAFLVAALCAVTVTCGTVLHERFDREYGPANPSAFDKRPAPGAAVSFERQVRPLLERRCVVCHACYDAPCQLKLTSWDGIARGGSKEAVYQASRVREARPTRLYEDAELPSQWRKLGFFPVLNERTHSQSANLAASLVYQMLAQKIRHPTPTGELLPPSFELSLGAKRQCPRIEEHAGYEKDHPLWGMPYGMPPLADAEHALLERWLAAGAPAEAPARLPAALEKELARWEVFLNGPSTKEQLVSRYLFEHLFLAHLHFAGDADQRFFRLVRSRTAPGQPVDRIATRRPYDPPGVGRVYYRLVLDPESVVDKTHMPYRMDDARMRRWRTLFLQPDYVVGLLPSYAPETAANPFVTFAALPLQSRHQFLLDDALFHIMTFIKGPVCRGQAALSVIDDHFWIVFADPSSQVVATAQFLATEQGDLRLPVAGAGSYSQLARWRQYHKRQQAYLSAKSDFLERQLGPGEKLDLHLVWDGDGKNPNAALTVFRNMDSATVVTGLVGPPPKTTWVVSYPLLERISYLLVVGFDVFGNLAHQLDARLYMDFLRMEAEFNFLAFLPDKSRRALAHYWYRGAEEEADSMVLGKVARMGREPDIAYTTADPQQELYQKLQQHLRPVLDHTLDIDRPDAAGGGQVQRALLKLGQAKGRVLAALPEVGVVRIEGAGDPVYATLLVNVGRSNVAHIAERDVLLPDEHTLTVVPGVFGAYPNALYRVKAAELDAFVDAITEGAAARDYGAFARRFAVRRTDPAIWTFSDEVQAAYRRQQPVDSGILDLARLENR